MSVDLEKREMQHLEEGGQPVSKEDARYIDGYIDTHSAYTTETKQHLQQAGQHMRLKGDQLLVIIL
jgi:hypothetical protein